MIIIDTQIEDSILNNIKETITLQGNNWTSILYDYAEKKFGIPVNAPMDYNKQLSDLVTNIFKNTKVNIYIYQSKKANIIGIPGANKNMTPAMLRNERASIDNLYINKNNNLSYTTQRSGALYETISNAIRNRNKDGGETKLIYDPNTNKLDINIDEVTVYISSNYINCMKHDDEVIASILCEIAKNTILFRTYMQDRILTKSLYVLLPITFLSGYAYSIYNLITMANNSENHISSSNPFYIILKIILPVILPITILLITYITLGIYISKKRNIEYDEFVVKCGYGDALNRAIDNYNKFIFGNSTTQSDAMDALNWFDKIAHFIGKIGAYIYNFISKFGITSKQSIQRRHNTIENKTNNYDYNLIDRSDRI